MAPLLYWSIRVAVCSLLPATQGQIPHWFCLDFFGWLFFFFYADLFMWLRWVFVAAGSLGFL